MSGLLTLYGCDTGCRLNIWFAGFIRVLSIKLREYYCRLQSQADLPLRQPKPPVPDRPYNPLTPRKLSQEHNKIQAGCGLTQPTGLIASKSEANSKVICLIGWISNQVAWDASALFNDLLLYAKASRVKRSRSTSCSSQADKACFIIQPRSALSVQPFDQLFQPTAKGYVRLKL